MKLQVKVADSVIGPSLLLCDEHGMPLPNQMRVESAQDVDDVGTVTVTFAIDGRRVGWAK